MHIIITGTSKGLGKRIALDLLNLGHSVTGYSRSPVDIDFDTYKQSGKYYHIITDLSDSKNIDLVVQELLKMKSGCIILNAAEYFPFKLGDIKTFDKQLGINLLFPLLLLNRLMDYHLWPLRIVNISSVMSFLPDAINPLYSASKSAIAAYINGLREKNIHTFSFLNVYAGPIKDDKSRTTVLRKLVSVSRLKASRLVIQQIDTASSSVYVPAIWGLAHLLIPSIPGLLIRKLLKNNRPI